MKAAPHNRDERVRFLREQWKALRLELLAPAKLTDKDFAAILAARDDGAADVFRVRLPMRVARFKSWIRDDIDIYGNVLRGNAAFGPEGTGRYRGVCLLMKDLGSAYERDIAKIHAVLFGNPYVRRLDAEEGIQTEARSPYLHADARTFTHAAVYMARLSAFPFWYISGKDQLKASAPVARLIANAMLDDEEFKNRFDWPERCILAPMAREELKRRKILKPSALGDVMMILGSVTSPNPGTLHCSAPFVPDRYSAFLRIDGQISPSVV